MRFRRDQWAWAGFALALAGIALPLMPWEGLRAALALALFWGVPGFLWRRRLGWPEESWIVALARGALDGALHDLVVLLVASAAGLPLRVGLAVWLASLLLPLRGGDPASARGPRGDRAALALVVCMALLALWMALTPLPPGLQRDSAAHVAGVLDALHADTWMPPDRSFDTDEVRTDPRFGVVHGLYAALAQVTHVHPRTLFEVGPVVMAPLWLLAHTALFFRFGLPAWAAVLAGVLFTVGGAGGRSFGLWFATYPSSVALTVGALSFADWIAGHDARRSLGLRPTRLRGPVALALSTLAHPFAWVGYATAAVHAVVLAMLSRRWRPRWRSLALETGLCLIAGVVLLLPRLVERGTTGGAHYQITDALLLGGGLFVVDPLVLEQWAGPAVWWSLPVLILLAVALRRWPRFLFATACVLPMWTISLDPFAQPVAWKVISYLSVRFGRLVFPAALWMLVMGSAWRGVRRARNVPARMGLLLALTVSVVLTAQEFVQTARVLSWGSLREDPAGWGRIDAIVDALDGLPDGQVLADPRLSYGLRARVGGPIVLYPVAHASPRDATLTLRLAWYRDVLDPTAPWTLVQSRLQSLRARYLVVHPGVEDLYVRPEFGFVPERAVQQKLLRRIADLGVWSVASGDAWSMFDVQDLLTRTEPEPPLVSAPEPPATPLAAPVEGSRFRVLAVEPLATSVVAGDTLSLRVWYQAHDGPARTVNPDWEQVFVRLEGPMPELPGWSQPFGKLYRKWIVERSGRSEARFGGRWVPMDGMPPPSRWVDGLAAETRTLRVPGFVRPGVYTVQPTVQEITWRPNRDWRDYLRDQDKYTGPVAATVEVRAR